MIAQVAVALLLLLSGITSPMARTAGISLTSTKLAAMELARSFLARMVSKSPPLATAVSNFL